MSTRFLITASAVALVMFVNVRPSRAQVVYGGGTYSEHFDALPTSPENASLQGTAGQWAQNSTIPGWYLFHPISQAEGGADGNSRLRAGPGSSTTGAFYSFGTSGQTERALGSLSSNTLANAGDYQFTGVQVRNNTGQTITQFTLGYTGEQWRDGGAGVVQKLDFQYSLTAGDIKGAFNTFTDVDALDFASPKSSATAATLDGNNAANRTVFTPVTVGNLNWAPGTDLWLRWADVNDANSDSGLAIDDLSFTTPEPSGSALALCGGLGLLGRRRRASSAA
jgi:hypothetical protein